MKNEEFERQIEFILKRQANFDDSLQRQADMLERQMEVQAELSRQQAEFYAEQIRRNAEANARYDRVDRQIQELIQSMSIFRDAFISLTHHAERHEREIADWIERGKQTDAHLNALILVVERHISGHQ